MSCWLLIYVCEGVAMMSKRWVVSLYIYLGNNSKLLLLSACTSAVVYRRFSPCSATVAVGAVQ